GEVCLILETPKQLAERVGLKERQIRSLIDAGKLEYVKIGCRVHIPRGAFERFIEQNKGTPCQDATTGQSYIGPKTHGPPISFGQSTVAAASARRVRQTANKLKSSSHNGCKPEAAKPAPVIQLKS